MNERIGKMHMECVDWLQDKQKKDLFWEKNEAKEMEMSLEWFSRSHAAKLLQPCPTLCDPIDGSPPGSPVPGILQARTLEWVAISFSNA